MNKERKWMAGACLMATVSMIAVTTMAAVEGVETSGWQEEYASGVTVQNDAGGVATVSFPAQGAPPSPTIVDLVAGGSPQTSPFAGDYVAAGIQGVNLKIMCANDNAGIKAEVILKGTDGAIWRYNITDKLSVTGGEWVEIAVPLKKSAGWYGPPSIFSFDNAISDVTMIGIELSRSGTAAEEVSVDDFVLVGDGFSSEPASLTDLQQALNDRFGVTSIDDLTDAQKTQDSDGDGMTDLAELIAGTNPDSAMEVLAAKIVNATKDGVTIQWSSVAGKSYTVARSANPGGPYQALVGGTGIQASGTVTEFTDTTVGGARTYFYRIVVDE